MNNRERFAAVLNGERPDRLPVLPGRSAAFAAADGGGAGSLRGAGPGSHLAARVWGAAGRAGFLPGLGLPGTFGAAPWAGRRRSRAEIPPTGAVPACAGGAGTGGC